MRAARAGHDAGDQQRPAGLRTVNRPDRHLLDRTVPGDREKYDISAVHPTVRTHPEHEPRPLNFHISRARYIEGMTAEASQVLMQDLLDRTIHGGIVNRHRWRQGDMAICDNRATMHCAHGDANGEHFRMLWRHSGGRLPGMVPGRPFTSCPSREQGPVRPGA